MKTKTTLILGIIVFIILMTLLISRENPEQKYFKYPTEYKTKEEFKADMSKWADNILAMNPDITQAQMMEKRTALFKKEKCTPGEWGNSDDEDTGVPNGSISPIEKFPLTESDEKKLKTFTGYDKFTFQYLSDESVKILPKIEDGGNRWVMIRPDVNNKNSIWINIASNSGGLSPEEWLLGPDSGFDTNDVYHKTKIDGQDAVYTDASMWTVVNTPDNKYRLSIADLNPDDNLRLTKEMNILIASFKFTR
jgi:hypothetical protein